MEKKLTNPEEQKLAQQYYVLKMKYRLLYGRYMRSLEETQQKHEQMLNAHEELQTFIRTNGKYDNVCPPPPNGFNI